LRWGGWALAPEMVMGVPLKVACSEVAIALGDAAVAATYLSAGFRLFGFASGGGYVGGLFWGRGLRRLARIVRLVVLGVLLLAAVNLLAP
jgi:hypothetical protein